MFKNYKHHDDCVSCDPAATLLAFLLSTLEFWEVDRDGMQGSGSAVSDGLWTSSFSPNSECAELPVPPMSVQVPSRYSGFSDWSVCPAASTPALGK